MNGTHISTASTSASTTMCQEQAPRPSHLLAPVSQMAPRLTPWAGAGSPMLVCRSARAVVSGTGMVMTTLSANSLLLKPALTFVFTSIRVLPNSVIRGVTCSSGTPISRANILRV